MGELLTNLGIDWRLLIAQIVNFLVLFFLLRKFLYRPVLAMLEKRRATIAEGVANAERATVVMADLAQERTQLQAAAAAERAAVLVRAAEEVETLRKTRTLAATEEASVILANAQEDADRVHAALLATVRGEIGDLVLAVTEKTTADALTAAEHEKLVDAALRELKTATL
ncbi:MAG: F0F1 ATP synthase subunit B [bacterium]|nr:F0F1 ATP synthase subunit B [bacterium]